MNKLMLVTGASTGGAPIWVATAPDLASSNGKFYGSDFGKDWKKELVVPAVAHDPELGKRLYAACEKLVGLS